MAQTGKEAPEETNNVRARMPLNAGDTGYGSVPSTGLSASVGARESSPLLMPDPEPHSPKQWQPLTKEELELAAGGSGWRKVRFYLVVVFWVAWGAMLATSIAIIVKSPRPAATPLKWWQKSVFYQLQPDMFNEKLNTGSEESNALSEQLPYLSYLGIGALILEGLYDKASPLNLTAPHEGSRTLAQIQHLLAESNKIGLKVVLDFCEPNVAGKANKPSNVSATAHHSLRFWLEQGIAGFAICDTDEAYSEKTMLEWRGVLKEFSSWGQERILMVKKMQDSLSPLNNISLMDVVMRPILPTSHHLLSAKEVMYAIETTLQTTDDVWPSWTVGGKTSRDLKRLLLVLTMTLPGSPTVQYDEEIHQTRVKNLYPKVSSTHGQTNESVADQETMRRSIVALFTSLSQSRAREEVLQHGNLTFLPFNTSTKSSNSTLTSPSSPILAYLRSWGCVHFLILLNVGPERCTLDPAWAPSLPEAGVFVSSTGMDRLGSMTLYTLELQPHEAVIIKLLEAGSYS